MKHVSCDLNRHFYLDCQKCKKKCLLPPFPQLCCISPSYYPEGFLRPEPYFAIWGRGCKGIPSRKNALIQAHKHVQIKAETVSQNAIFILSFSYVTYIYLRNKETQQTLWGIVDWLCNASLSCIRSHYMKAVSKRQNTADLVNIFRYVYLMACA